MLRRFTDVKKKRRISFKTFDQRINVFRQVHNILQVYILNSEVLSFLYKYLLFPQTFCILKNTNWSKFIAKCIGRERKTLRISGGGG